MTRGSQHDELALRARLPRSHAQSHQHCHKRASPKWDRALLEADAASLSALMLAARRRSGSCSFVAEEIAAALAEVGVLWELGTCKIFEEHAASEALRRAAASCSGQIALKSKAPSALLLTVAGDRHTLGLSLSELIIAEAGWRTSRHTPWKSGGRHSSQCGHVWNLSSRAACDRRKRANGTAPRG